MEKRTEDIRNVGLVGHSGSGKTSLSEAMLFCAGVTNRMGTVQDGNTVSDYHHDEIEHQMSMHSSLMGFELNNITYNVIDMPGYADFMGDVKGCLRVCDLALFTIDVVDGLLIGTERCWKFANELELPRILCVNGLDRENSNFDNLLTSLKDRWGNQVAPLQLPLDEGTNFNSVIDLVLNKKLTWEKGGDGKWTESDIPSDLEDLAITARQELIEAIAESDDTLIEKYLENGDLSQEEIQQGLISAILQQKIFPVVCCSATNNIGVKRLLDIIAEYSPSPDKNNTLVDSEGNNVAITSDAPASAFVFKTVVEQHVGDLSFFKVCTGNVNSGDDLKNAENGSSERLNQIFIMTGKNRTDATSLPAGSIAAVVKLKHTHTGNTLADAKHIVKYPPTSYPQPCIRFAMAPASKGDEDKFSRALSSIHEEDPTFQYEVHPETSQTIVSGMGEMHITTNMERIQRRYKLEMVVSEPKVPYRETIRAKSDAKYRHKKQTGGAGQFAEVWMRIEPQERGAGIDFVESLVGQNVDRGFVPSVDKGVKAVCKEGIIAGCQVVDVKADFYDGKMHPVDSNDMAFQIAGRGAFKQAFESAKPYLLEPIYDIEVHVPEQYMGDVMGDIASRRGRVQGIDSDGHFQVIKAQVPLANLYKYSTLLRSITQGTAEHTEEFSHYEEMPSNLAQKIVEEYKEGKKSGDKVLVGSMAD